jgi:hypothetical protein
MDLYKKMSATASEIQVSRFMISDTMARCCRPGRYEEEDLFDWRPVQKLSDEEKAAQVEEFAWVPTHVDLQEVFFGDRRIRGSKELDNEWFKKWREENPDIMEKVKSEIQSDHRWDALTLLFVMYRRFDKAWNWEAARWEKK